MILCFFGFFAGIGFWNTKTQIRAIVLEVYKHYKLSAYNLVKKDYGLNDENLLDDKLLNLFRNDDVFNSYHAAKNVEIGDDLAEKIVEEGKLLDDIKNVLNTKFEEIKGELKTFTEDSKNVLEFQSIFWCIVCYSTTQNCYSACVFCGLYLGCYNCICRLDSCPVCRKSFNVVVVKNFHASRCLFLVSKIFWKYQTLEEMKCVKTHELTTIVFRQPTRYQWHCRKNDNKLRTYAHRQFLWPNDSD